MPHNKLHASEHTNGTDDIAEATTGTKGLMSASDKTKLDGIDLATINDQRGAPYTLLAADAGKVITIDDDLTLPDGLPVGFQCSIINEAITPVALTLGGFVAVFGNDTAANISGTGVISLVSVRSNIYFISGEMEA